MFFHVETYMFRIVSPERGVLRIAAFSAGLLDLHELLQRLSVICLKFVICDLNGLSRKR